MDEDNLEDLWREPDEAETGQSRPDWWRMMIMMLTTIWRQWKNFYFFPFPAYN